MNLLLEKLKDNFLKNGFLKKGNLYVFNNELSFLLCNIQKSKFDETIFLNFGVLYKKLCNNLIKINIDYAHFVGRYHQILEVENDGIILNLDTNAIDEIITNINVEIIPFLKSLDDNLNVAKFLKSDKFFKKMWLQNINSANLLDQLKEKSP